MVGGHIYSITGVGGKHVFLRGINAEEIFQTIVEEDVSYFCAAPTVLNMLLEYYDKHEPQTLGANQVRIAAGGSAPPEATIQTIEDELGWHLEHIYGATKIGPLITTSDARRFLEDESARFRVKKRQGFGFLGTEIRVVDQEGNDVPRDDEAIGEVVVRGNQVMEGYWEQPQVTNQEFNDRIEDYYHMGDLATVDEHGMIAIQDRKRISSLAVKIFQV